MAGHLNTARKEHNNECGSSSSNELRILGDADRISLLPLEIQNQIVSLLPAIDAAKVGLLSRMWRATWHSLSKLAFDCRQFPYNIETQSFVHFIDKTLATHDESDIKILEIRPCPIFDVSIKKKWIVFARQHNVEKLVLYGSSVCGKKLPNCMFSWHSLVKLELAIQQFVLTLPKTITLPNLLKLKLKFTVLSEVEDLISSLPALEKLSLFFCSLGVNKVLSVSSLKLREFIMCDCTWMESCSLVLQTPSLSTFIYISDYLIENEVEIPAPSELKLVINGECACMESRSTTDLSHSLVKVTRVLFEKIYLILSHWLIEYLSMARDLTRQLASDVFRNLSMLDINLWPVMEHVRIMILLVSQCPNLVSLSLEIVPSQRREAIQLPDVNYLVDFDIEGGFHRMMYISIQNYGADETELMLVRFLLAHASKLHELKIVMNIYMVNNDMRKKITEILGYEKASPCADVIFD